GVMRREEIHAVVSPAPISREFVHRHQLNVRDAEACKMSQTFGSAVESAFRRERADVQLVKYGGGKWRRLPSLIGPLEGGVIEEARGTVHALRLPWRAWIGQRLRAIEHIPIVHARR